MVTSRCFRLSYRQDALLRRRMTVYDEVVALSDKLSIVEKVKLLERMSAALKQALAVEGYKHIP